jgi:site-specific DNA recombinase
MNDLIMPKSKCFVYLRRSQDREDRQQLSLEKQDNQVKEAIKEHKVSPIHLPAEEMSAKKPGRPIFNNMLDRIEAGEARYIVVWHLSRLSRNSVDGGKIIYMLDTGQLLGIITPTRVYRNTPDDKAFLAIELAFAKKNNDDLGVQVKESYVVKRQHGEYPGPAFLGYDNIIVRPGIRNIAPNSEEGPKLYDVFVYASSGMYTLDQVWQYARQVGLKAPRGDNGQLIAKTTLENAIRRRDYTGWFKRGGKEWVKGSYDALIDVDLFNKVQAAMGWANIRKAAHSTSGRFYPYKGPLTCGTCKYNVTAYTKSKQLASGTTENYIFYTCSKKSKTMKCKEPQLANAELEAEIVARVSEFEIDSNGAQVCKDVVHDLFNDYKKHQNRYIEVWKQDQKEAKNALDLLDSKLEKGVMSDERYVARSARHEQTIARTKELLKDSDKDAERWLELADELFTSVTNIGDVFQEADDVDRHQLMLYLGLNWTLSNKKVALTPREPLSLLRHNSYESDWRARPDSNRRSPP